MNYRVKWLGDKIENFLQNEHTIDEMKNMLKYVQDECKTISTISDAPF